MRDLLESTISDTKQGEILRTYDRLERFEPDDPHWLLQVIGIEPMWQDRGYGTHLLAPVLAECDETGVDAFLQSINRRNLTFYERGRRHPCESEGGRCATVLSNGASPTALTADS